MSSEALQQLLTMVGQAGEGALTVAILYIAKGSFMGVLFTGVVVYVAATSARLLSNSNEDRKMLRTIVDILDVQDSYGHPLSYDGYRSERKCLLDAVRMAAE